MDELLDERGVDFGDDYSRDALEAFSADDRLQCMPYGISPMVIYYNTRLVDFDRMRARGCPRPDGAGGADRLDLRAVRRRRRVRDPAAPGAPAGCTIAPTLGGLAPFIVLRRRQRLRRRHRPDVARVLRGQQPGRAGATLELLRNPQVTLSRPSSWPRRPRWSGSSAGKLGMIAGLPRAGARSCARCRAWSST